MKGKKERKTIKSVHQKRHLEKGKSINGQLPRLTGKRMVNNSQPKQNKRFFRKPFRFRTEIEFRYSTPAGDRFKPRYGKIGIQICEITQRAILKRIDSEEEGQKGEDLGNSCSFRKMHKQNSFEDHNNEEQSKVDLKVQQYGLQSSGQKGRKSTSQNTMSGYSDDQDKELAHLKREAQYYKMMYGNSLQALQRIQNKISSEQFQFQMQKKLYEDQIKKLTRLNKKCEGVHHHKGEPYNRMIPESFIVEKSISSSILQQ